MSERRRKSRGCWGRPLIAEARDWETHWTDLHYAAAADLPEAVCGNWWVPGFPVDARLASGGRAFGKRLLGVLSGLGNERSFKGWRADGETALMIAAYTGSLRAAAALERHGAVIHAKNDYGATPAHFGAASDVVSMLGWLASRNVEHPCEEQ